NIYISSLSNDKLMSFYKIFIDFFDIRILDGENIEELFNKENILFIYDINFYDKLNINKISLIELDKILKLQYINYSKSVLSIESSWASVNIKECNVLNCIKLFDQGYNSIYIEDDNKKYVSTIFRHNFKEDLFKNNLKKWADCYVVYSEKINELYSDLISNFFGNGRQEIPILMNGEIKASCCKTNKFDLPLFWDYISEVSIQEYFGDRKILLSSYSCELKIFYDRYKNYLNITILDNIEKLYQYFNKKYDIVIYSSDVWDIFDTLTIDIRQVYLDLLGEYVKNFLEKKKIEYYYFEVPKHTYEIVNYNKRHSKELIKKMLPGITQLTQSCINMGEYYIYPDIQSETRNVKNGNRKTMGNPINSDNSIFFYGACTNFGIDVSDEETIESYLQKIINVKHGKTYKVVNAGGMFGSDLIQDINSLYIILKQELKEEDIIIQLGFNMWKNSLIHNIDNYYSLIELFNKADNRYQCYFDDWVGHLNKLGNETVAEYIYNKIFV
ncbi:hypothetical protein, partial [Anaerocolumna jejuensis]|uniref:hypothetical protein n=1 Tax=Anaerocolumna jejuensis TaxID=259063 RepID=UPI003F7C9924